MIASVSPESLKKAETILDAGGLVVVPTETVYGLAADATNGEAVARIYDVKGRPSFNPLIVHVDGPAMAARSAHLSSIAEKAMATFWPGPLTLVLPYREGSGLSSLVRAGLATVALRMPVGPMTEIIEHLDRPLAAPSANRSGRVTGTSAINVQNDLGDRIELILDGGNSSVGLESTILHLTENAGALLRPGAVTQDMLEDALSIKIEVAKGERVLAPGMLTSHYAPDAAVVLNAEDTGDADGALNFAGSQLNARVSLSLSDKGDLVEAAAKLFRHLAAFDKAGVKKIAVAPIPPEGLGVAINDRLQRAAAPRDEL